MFGGVGQRLGDDVISRDFNRFGQPAIDVEVQLDWDGGTSRKRLDRRTKPALRQDGRVDASRYLLQFL